MGNDTAVFGSCTEMTGVDCRSALFLFRFDRGSSRATLAETAWAQTGRFEPFWAKLNGPGLTSKLKYLKHESYIQTGHIHRAMPPIRPTPRISVK